jgi:twitching motility protein PilT
MIPNMEDLLKLMVEVGASDLHITVGVPPVFRIDGRITRTDFDVLRPEDTKRLVYEILTETQIERFEREKELDFSFELEGISRYRVNVFWQRGNVASVIRAIPTKIRTIDELMLPKAVYDLCNLRRGLVLVTGITGSGKSTTLAAMIDYINSTRAEHIITIEDPIEFVHQHKKSIVNQREVYEDTRSFAEALKRALREDPDVILVGEMRDLETTSMAITAAETGHLVLSTLHTIDAPQTIDRIVDQYPPHQQQQVRVMLSGCLAGVLSQQLLPRATGKGRVAAVAVMINTPAIANLIREGKTAQIYSYIQSGGQYGMQTMDQALRDLVLKRLVRFEDALERAENKQEFKQLVGRA